MAVKIQGGSSTAGQANVTSTYDLQVATSQTLTQVGGSVAVAQVDAGTVTGTRNVRALDISDDYRARVGVDQPVFRDIFAYATVNSTRYSVITATATAAFSGRKWTLNGGSSVTTGQSAQVSTRANFQFSQSYPVYAEIWAAIPNAPQSNTVLEWGFGYASATSVPTDGVFFRYASGGEIRGVINVAGAEVQTDPFTNQPGGIGYFAGKQHHWLIIADADQVEFWQDDVQLATIQRSTTEGGTSSSLSLPLFARFYNSAGASAAQQLALTGWSAYTGDATNQKEPSHVAAINGHSVTNLPDFGSNAGQTANYANTAAPASLTLSNTTSTNGVNVLGGQWQFAAVGGAETDYMVFAFQNPAGSATVPGKNLLVYGVTIHSYNMGAASATTPTVLQWGLGFGSTAVSLATADSLTTGAQGPRRITVGVQSFPVATPIGGVPDKQIDFRKQSPDVVPPGGFLHLILKMPVGTATASQIIRGIATFDAHFEVA